jgi:hypothetical protein
LALASVLRATGERNPRWDGEHKVTSFSCLDQFYAMAFAQLTFRESLRDMKRAWPRRAIGCTVARHTSAKRRQRQVRHDLREHELALMHRRRPSRGTPAMGAKSAARRSNRDQTRRAICLGRSSTYQRLG